MIEPGWLVVVLGSNVERERNLSKAIDRLTARLDVVRVSAIYETPPVDAPGTPRFWNAAALVRSDIEPARIKFEVLRPLEAELGRVRGADPNSPRTIDLDLVLWSGGVVDDAAAGLRLPDPDLATMAHLAVPVAELVPDWVDPESGLTLDRLAERFSSAAVKIDG